LVHLFQKSTTKIHFSFFFDVYTLAMVGDISSELQSFARKNWKEKFSHSRNWCFRIGLFL